MAKRHILLTIASLLACMARADGTGSWKNYMAYSDITDVKQGAGLIYVLASSSLYSYNPSDMSLWTYDKANTLNDCEIQFIEWCQAAGRLVIVYASGNIDLLDKSDRVTNIADYKDKTMTSDKTIYGIDVVGQYAYLCTGFGIVKVNVMDGEIANTYNLGFRVDYCYEENGRIYAASSTMGTYSALLTSNLLDPSSWSYTSEYVERAKAVDPELLALAQTLSPGGPAKNWFHWVKYENDRLYTAGGFFLSGYAEENRTGTVQVMRMEDESWTVCQDNMRDITGIRYRDINCAVGDPDDPDHVFAGGKPGLYEFRDGNFVLLYNSDNSPLQCTMDGNTLLSNDYVQIHSLMYDEDGTLWMLNSQAPNASIIELRRNGDIIRHDHEELMDDGCSLPCMVGLMKDSRGLLWFVNNNHLKPSFYCYQPSTEGINSYEPKMNQDGTTLYIEGIKCVAEDKEGNIWVGTSTGPLLLYAQDITSAAPEYNQFKVPRNDGTNYADYLLGGIDILSMRVDPAGRKWFGTYGNGVYLISADNTEQVHHFTSGDSPLLSDIVWSIDMNEKSGEVFFGTEKGLCSYFSDATETSEEMTKDNVYAYPNPVRPDYTGLITVTGLTLDADVKIVTSNGVLVAQGRSTGGTFTWDGRDVNGKRVASGVYMVQTATAEGKKGTVCKIAVVR